jgi:hypothetical protein
MDRPLKTYSTGMQVRLGFAVAISVDPDVLVVDEALAVGDVFFQQKCVRHMREALSSCTKVLVSHDLHQISNLSDRVLVLEEGKASFLGTPLEAIEHYTRLLHTATYGNRSAIEPGGVDSGKEPISDATLPWVEVPPTSRGGAGSVVIECVALTDLDGQMTRIARGGDPLVVHVLVDVPPGEWDLIFGYIFNDRVGNPIFGENTIQARGGPIRFTTEGRYRVSLRFRWPEIQPGVYTLTPGVGDGVEAAGHRIQCWAHSIIAVEAISPDRFVHCLFNNDIEAVDVARLD